MSENGKFFAKILTKVTRLTEPMLPQICILNKKKKNVKHDNSIHFKVM